MERAQFAVVIGLLIVATTSLEAQEPTPPTGEFQRSLSAPRVPAADLLTTPSLLGQVQPEDKDKKDKKDKKTAPPLEDLAQLPPTPTEAPRGINPNMLGDLGVYSFTTLSMPATARVVVTIPGTPGSPGDPQRGIPPTPPTPPRQQIINIPTTVQTQVRVPVFSRGGSKIAENESPVPQDRLFFTYNYYNNVHAPAHGSDQPRTVNQTFLVGGVPFTVPVTVPGVQPPRGDLHRETVGFEKTFFDGNASFGLRVPFLQAQGDEKFSARDVGDMTLILKYAPLLDFEAGDALSVGLAVTVPTGRDIPTPSGDVHPTVLQPFVGYMFSGDRFFFHGFTSIAVPTDDRDVTLLFNDIGVGFWAYRGMGDGLVRSIVPTIEAHVTTPLDHRSVFDPIAASDLVVLTGGLHVGLGERSLLTLGVATPVTGPRLFSVEAIVQFNIRF